MSEAGTSKQIKPKDLSLAVKILVIDELEKKHCKVQSPKNLEYRKFLKAERKLLYVHRNNLNPNHKMARKSRLPKKIYVRGSFIAMV